MRSSSAVDKFDSADPNLMLFGPEPILNLHVPSQPESTAGRTTPASETGSNGERHSRHVVTPDQTGRMYVAVPKEETSTEFQPISTYDIIVRSEELAQIIYNHLSAWLGCASIGGTLVQANHTKPGKKPLLILTLRIPLLNGGMGTRVREMLLLTNFEELYKSPIFSDGLTSTLAVYKRKEPTSHFTPRTFGSRRIWTLDPGILSWMNNLWEHYSGDLR